MWELSDRSGTKALPTQDFSGPDGQTTQSNLALSLNYILYYLFQFDWLVRFYISLTFQIPTNKVVCLVLLVQVMCDAPGIRSPKAYVSRTLSCFGNERYSGEKKKQKNKEKTELISSIILNLLLYNTACIL